MTVNFDPSGRFVLPNVLEAEDSAMVVDVVLGNTVPGEFDHLILKLKFEIHKQHHKEVICTQVTS